MDNNTAQVLIVFILWGWIPILAIAKALSWIIDSIKNIKRN